MFPQIMFSDILATSICKLCVSIWLPGEIWCRESVKYVNDTAINSRLRLVCQLQIVAVPASQPVFLVGLYPIYFRIVVSFNSNKVLYYVLQYK